MRELKDSVEGWREVMAVVPALHSFENFITAVVSI